MKLKKTIYKIALPLFGLVTLTLLVLGILAAHELLMFGVVFAMGTMNGFMEYQSLCAKTAKETDKPKEDRQ